MKSIHDYVLSNLEGKRLGQLSRESGIPFGTLRKIREGTSKAPRIDTLERIAEYFRKQERRAEVRPS
jgi:predicted transcriptional regulator